MAPPPKEQAAESAEPQRLTPTPFLSKTYQLVDDPSVDDIISWNQDGTTFVVWRPAEFARDLLPMYFKHNNFSSFVRQLNTYGFRKIVPDRWEFSNDCFRRGEKHLLCEIHRRRINAQGAPPTVIQVAIPLKMDSPASSAEEQGQCSNSSPIVFAGDLAEENDRLRKENTQLNQELLKMKTLCNNIMLLVSKYQLAGSGSTEAGAETIDPTVERERPTAPALDLLPLKSCSSSEEETSREDKLDDSPMLFGVHIGVKRLRVGDPEQPPQSPLKSEHLDDSSFAARGEEFHRRRWLACEVGSDGKAWNRSLT